jgi:PhnB protein
MIKNITPYLRFDGQASEAIGLYQRALGAKVESKMTFAEMPGGNVPDAFKDRVMYSVIAVGELRLSVLDAPPSMKVTRGDNVQVTLEYDDPKEMTGGFEALAEGGRIVMPLHDAFFGAGFGVLTDRYGVSWVFVGPKVGIPPPSNAPKA